MYYKKSAPTLPQATALPGTPQLPALPKAVQGEAFGPVRQDKDGAARRQTAGHLCCFAPPAGGGY